MPCSTVDPSLSLPLGMPVLLTNRWLELAGDGSIVSIRLHFYAGQGKLDHLKEFLEERSSSDWRVARWFGPPEVRFDPRQTDASLYPPAPPVYPSHPRFLADPELLFADAMTDLIVDLPYGFFVDQGDLGPLCYTAVVEQQSENELRFLSQGDRRFPAAIARSALSWHW